MSLDPGRKLAHYEILELVGKGGMGEVYRAKDTKLGRDVAIKVLPDAFAEDPGRLRRFEREAKVLASLNHPNIASIYGLEQLGDTHYLVLELVPGRTLAERIAEGPIPLDEAFGIAERISEALQEAHEQGIVHRDLKPANVKLTPDGKVKVLDFGLAKAFVEEDTESAGTDSMLPTITRDATRAGIILGTAAYMSPEQARGERLDRRTDVWAFGVVLFEMLTGQPAFPGKSVSDVLAAVIKDEPRWTALPSDTPSGARELLRFCLDKDPKKRLQALGDARLLLSMSSDVSQDPPASTSRLATLGALLLGSVATALLLWSLGGSRSEPSAVARFTVPMPEWQEGPFWSQVALSPEGDTIAFNIGDDIYLRPIGTLEMNRVTDIGPATAPFFSEDGRWLGFLGGGELKKISLDGGGGAIALCDVSGVDLGASWDARDAILFAQSPGGIYRVAASGGRPELVVPIEDEEIAQFPQLLPGGDVVLFTLRPSNATTWEESRIVAHSIRRNERTVLIEGGRLGVRIDTGHLLYSRDGTLFAAPFDHSRVALGRAPVPVLENMRGDGWLSVAKQFSVSRNGTLAFLAVNDSNLRRSLVWRRRDGAEEPVGLPPRGYSRIELSPDGTRVALDVREQGDNRDIWIHDLTQSTTQRLTFDQAADDNPVWTPDGERIVFLSERDGGGLFWKRSDGTGSVERLTSGEYGLSFPYSVTPDGKRVVFNVRHASNSWDIKAVSLEGSHAVVPLLETRFGERRGSVSPDGRWIAYQSDETGEDNVFVRPFPKVDEGKWQISMDGGRSPLWARDAGALFFTRGDGEVWQVDIGRTNSFTSSAPELVLEGNFALGQRGYAVAPDGERFLVLKRDRSRREIHVALNWFNELERLVPIP